jgi:tRNA pseudouridine55 synthase
MYEKNNVKYNFNDGEILNINKPKGMTSFGVVNKIKYWTGCKKVGHAGTLDPLATGVLLICTGKSTKLVSELMALEKTYEGTIELGKSTETDDEEGKIIIEKMVPEYSKDKILSVLRKFKGEINQVPPMYSAIKKNGQRLYKLARKGIVIPREPRIVKIHEIKLLEWKRPFIRVRISCSMGTYIRALARDIGEILSTGGYLKSLCRTRIGTYYLGESYSVEYFRKLIFDYASI